MTVDFASLGMAGLTDGQKLDMVGRLWDDLFSNAPPGSLMTEAQKGELLRRQADARTRPDDWVPWEERLKSRSFLLRKRDLLTSPFGLFGIGVS